LFTGKLLMVPITRNCSPAHAPTT